LNDPPMTQITQMSSHDRVAFDLRNLRTWGMVRLLVICG